MSEEIQCLSCGASISIDAKYARVAACKYCNSVYDFGAGELRLIGQQAELIQFPSIFVVGKTTVFQNHTLLVHGQVRYEYDGGFFDVFFVECDGKRFLIQEDDGMMTSLEKTDWMQSPVTLAPDMLGQRISFLGDVFFVQEVGEHRAVHVSGSIDIAIKIDQVYQYYDGVFGDQQVFIERDMTSGQIRISRSILLDEYLR